MKTPKKNKKTGRIPKSAVTLRSVAELVGLTASTVSAVLNSSSASRSVPERTKKTDFGSGSGPRLSAEFLRAFSSS
jgi:hypothetical protein